MFTRRENSKDPEFEKYIAENSADPGTSQMIYYTENIAAGTPFYWKVVLEEVTPLELDFFNAVIGLFKRNPVFGGKGATGFGQVDIERISWSEIDNSKGFISVVIGESTESLFARVMTDNKASIKKFLSEI
jgi:hypothetical protein